MSDEARQQEPPKALAPEVRHPFAAVLATHLHAILVGVFTLASSVISALLGYQFAHEDRQSMMALEYDKLRAEHTLDIVKALTTAEAHMIGVSVDGSHAQTVTCGLNERIMMFAGRIAKAKPLPLKNDPDLDLAALEVHLKSPEITPEARDAWLLEHAMLKAELQTTEESVQARLKAYGDLTRKLTGDTAATMRVYHRDRGDAYMKLTMSFLQLNTEARQLMWKPVCGGEAKWDALTPKLLEWNGEAAKFSESLGIALKPE